MALGPSRHQRCALTACSVAPPAAAAVRAAGAQVGLLDIDICGPSVPKMLGLEGHEVHQSNSGWSPVYVEDNLAVMSIGEGVTDCPLDLVALFGPPPLPHPFFKRGGMDISWGRHEP